MEGGQTGWRVDITGWRVDRQGGGWTDGIEGGQMGQRVDRRGGGWI